VKVEKKNEFQIFEGPQTPIEEGSLYLKEKFPNKKKVF
jgi:hypothetical protein